MPLYDFQCDQCMRRLERLAGIHEMTKICECGEVMRRLITTRFYAQSDWEPYLDEHIGDKPMWVTSRRHRRQLMKRFGVAEIG